MANRIYNFSAGPATLPLPVLEHAQAELLDMGGTGMSILEMSHRTKPYEEVNAEAERLAKELLNIPEGYRVLFLQGGAHLQFDMVPMNFLGEGKTADYIITGAWSEKAYEEAGKVAKGTPRVAFTSKETNHNRIPDISEIDFDADAAYVHITSNNTIFGTQWQAFPDLGKAKMVADMSSDIMCKPFDVSRFGLIYAGAQKNLGPAGVTMVIIDSEWLTKASRDVPTMLRYDIHAKNDSLYNTPPCFPVYMVMLVERWIRDSGGLIAMEEMNKAKAALVYDAIDTSGGFYRGHAQPDSRSLMNVTFRLPSEELEEAFVKGAAKEGMSGLKGHRSVGGIRASIYNAMPLAGCQTLAQYMKEFAAKQG